MRIFCLLLLLLPTLSLAAPSNLLFDQGHRQAFLADRDGPLQLSRLAGILHQQGQNVAISEQLLTDELLSGFDALVISGAFQPLSEAEIAAVLKFINRGGKLAVMVHVGQPLLTLLHRLGVDVGNMVINEKPRPPHDKSIDFEVTSFKPHPLTRGLDSFSLYGGWPLRSFEQEGQAIASSSPHSWIDINQDKQLTKADLMSPFDVIITGNRGRGSFVVFGDDAIFQNRFLHSGNQALAENLGRWLKADDHRQLEI